MAPRKEERKRRWWKIPLVILLVIVLVVGGYVGYVFGTYDRIEDNQDLEVTHRTNEKAQPGETYTVVSYNIGFGAYTADFTFFMDGGKESRARSKESVITCVEGTTDTALSYEPDFVLFQEVDTDSTRSHHVDESALILERIAGNGDFDSTFAQNYHSAYLMYPFTQPHGASNSGLLTISKKGISSALRRSLPIATDVKKILDLDRCYCINRIPVSNGKELILVNLHLSAYGTDAAQGNAQLEMLFADMQKEYEKGNYVICGGDYNHDFTGDSRQALNPNTDEEYSWCHAFPDEVLPEGFVKHTEYADGLVSTSRNTNIPYCEDSFTVVLDGFITTDNVTCEYVQNIDTGYTYTDHNPVVMKFRLEP